MIFFKLTVILSMWLIIGQAFAFPQKCREVMIDYKTWGNNPPTGFLDLPPSITKALYREGLDSVKKLRRKTFQELLDLGLSEREVRAITQALQKNILSDSATQHSYKRKH